MKRSRKISAEPKPALPVAFRPGPDLGQLVGAFACRHTLNSNAAYRDLAALAVVGLDSRHYTLLAQLAEVLVGDNGFSRACLSVHAALVGAAVARGGLPPYEEPHRSQLVFDAVREFLTERGREVRTDGLWFTPETKPDVVLRLPAAQIEIECKQSLPERPAEPRRGVRRRLPKQRKQAAPEPVAGPQETERGGTKQADRAAELER